MAEMTEISTITSEVEKKSADEQDAVDEYGENDDTIVLPHKRIQWGSKLEFILTTIGFAVGLGNVWRFPYLCYEHGGGTFLIPYFTMLFISGIPMFMVELSFGQFASLGPIAIWKMFPFFKGVGACAVIISVGIGFYYNMVISYAIFFLVQSFKAELPWTKCLPEWENCKVYNSSEVDQLLKNGSYCQHYANSTNVSTAAQLYFQKVVLKRADSISDFGQVQWELAVCLFAAWLLVFLVLVKGIQSLGKIVYFTSTFPYVLLTAMLIWCVQLPQANRGISFYMSSNLTKLQDIKPWKDAAVQIFYSLSVCSGGLIAMASYNNFKNNVLRDSLLVPIINCLTSFYGGFVLFSVLGYMSEVKCVDVGVVANQGPGLVFETYPEALALMKPPQLWSVFFFLMLCILGFSSEFSIVETVLTTFIDAMPSVFSEQFNNKAARNKLVLRATYCLLMFGLGLIMCTQSGIYLLSVMDSMIGGLPPLFVGIFELIVIMWIYGISRFWSDIELMIGKKPFKYMWNFKICWFLITPLTLIGISIFLFKDFKPLEQSPGVPHPAWAQAFGWLLFSIPVGMIPGWMIYYCCKKRISSGKQVRGLFKPSWGWGPALPENWTGHYEHLKASNVYEKRPIYIHENTYDLPSLPRNPESYRNVTYITD